MLAFMFIPATAHGADDGDNEAPLTWGPTKRGEFGATRAGKQMAFDFESGKAGVAGSKLGKYDVKYLSGDKLQAQEIARMDVDYPNITSLEDVTFEKKVPMVLGAVYLIKTNEGALVRMKIESGLLGDAPTMRIIYSFAAEPEEMPEEQPPTSDINWTDERSASIGWTYKGAMQQFDFDKGKLSGVSNTLGKADLRLDTDETFTARAIAMFPAAEFDDLDNLEDLTWKTTLPVKWGYAYVVLTSDGRWAKFKIESGLMGDQPREDITYVLSMKDGEEDPSKVGASLAGLSFLDDDSAAMLSSLTFTLLLFGVAKVTRRSKAA